MKRIVVSLLTAMWILAMCGAGWAAAPAAASAGAATSAPEAASVRAERTARSLAGAEFLWGIVYGTFFTVGLLTALSEVLFLPGLSSRDRRMTALVFGLGWPIAASLILAACRGWPDNWLCVIFNGAFAALLVLRLRRHYPRYRWTLRMTYLFLGWALLPSLGKILLSAAAAAQNLGSPS